MWKWAPASQLKGGLNSETKSFLTRLVSSSTVQKQTQTLRPASHIESMSALLKSTLWNSVSGGYSKAEGPSRLCTKSRNLTSTMCSSSELHPLFSSLYVILFVSLLCSSFCMFISSKALRSTLNDLLSEPPEEEWTPFNLWEGWNRRRCNIKTIRPSLIKTGSCVCRCTHALRQPPVCSYMQEEGALGGASAEQMSSKWWNNAAEKSWT